MFTFYVLLFNTNYIRFFLISSLLIFFVHILFPEFPCVSLQMGWNIIVKLIIFPVLLFHSAESMKSYDISFYSLSLQDIRSFTETFIKSVSFFNMCAYDFPCSKWRESFSQPTMEKKLIEIYRIRANFKKAMKFFAMKAF